MDNVVAIARSTYFRHAKSKPLYMLWILLIALIAIANRYEVLTIGRSKILLVDLGLALISLVGAGSVLVLGFEIPRELRQKQAENLLSKPVGRDQYLAGKFLGSLAFSLSNVVFVAFGFCIVVIFSEGNLSRDLFIPLIGIVGMVMMLAAVGAFFGTFLGEVPAVVATFLVFWLGHSTQALIHLGDGQNVAAQAVLKLIYGVLPNLWLLNTRADTSQALFQSGPPMLWSYAGQSLAYAALYAAVTFAAAMLVFRQRDL